jgi:hypothetical protein
MSTDMDQVGVALFPSFQHFLLFHISRFSFYINIMGKRVLKQEPYGQLFFLFLFILTSIELKGKLQLEILQGIRHVFAKVEIM